MPNGSLIGSYGRAVYEATSEALGNGRGDQQRRNAHIPRQALRGTLLRGLAEGTVQWGHRLQAYEEDEEGVTLRFVGDGEARANPNPDPDPDPNPNPSPKPKPRPKPKHNSKPNPVPKPGPQP